MPTKALNAGIMQFEPQTREVAKALGVAAHTGAMGLMTNSDAVFKLRLSSHTATLLVSTIERSTRMETQVCHMQELPGRAERTGTTEMGNLGSSISAAGGA